MAVDPEFQQKVVDYLSTVIKQHSPFSTGQNIQEDEPMDEEIVETEPVKKAKADQKKEEGIYCNINETKLKSDEALSICDRETQKDNILTRKPLDPDSPDFAVNLNNEIHELVKYCNLHKHCATCRKYGRNDCRFDFPRKLVKESIVRNGEIMLQRLEPWVNNFNEICLVCLRSNMDIKFLGSGKDCKATIFYCTDYQTKTGLNAHNVLPLVASVLKNMEIGRNKREYENCIARSKAMIYKCVNRITSESEMSAVHIASLLMGFPDNYTSHTFRVLNILSFLSKIPEEDSNTDIESQCKIEEGNNGMVLLDDTSDYMMRGEALRDMSLYEYTSLIEKITFRSEGRLKSQEEEVKKGRPKNERLKFCDEHPQSQTHLQRKRSSPIVPRLTWFPPCEQSNPEKFAKCILIMFKPFTEVTKLKEHNMSWYEAFKAYNFKDEHLLHIAHIREMQQGLSRKAEMDEIRKQCTEENDAEILSTDEKYYYISDDEEIDDLEEESINDLMTITSSKTNSSTDEGVKIISKARCLQNVNPSNNCLFDVQNDTPSKQVTRRLLQNWKDKIEEYRAKIRNQMIKDSNVKKTSRIEDIHSEQLVTRTDSCYTTHGDKYEDIVQNVAAEFNLNKKQKQAFELIATNVIKILNCLDVNQRLVYLGGAGGTGKSQVIKAIRHLHEILKVSYSIKISAYTGTAAAEINGHTISSLLHISRNGNNRSDIKKLETTWESVQTLIIDEVSMISCSFLAKIHKQLIKAKHSISTIPYAGIDILFVGDFRQFAPILSSPLYYGSHSDSETKPIKRQWHLDREFGRTLWHQLTDVIILTEQNRISDKAYSKLLTRISEGRGTREDYNTLNSRLITNLDVTTGKFTNAPVVVPGNDLRQKINRAHAKHQSRNEGKRLFISTAVDTCSKVDMTESKLMTTHQLSYTKAGNLPSELELFKGLPVMLTQNIAVELGLTNGAFGEVTQIGFDKDHKMTKKDDSYLLESVPQYVIVKFPCLKHLKLPGLNIGEVPVFPVKSSFRIKFPGTVVKSTINRLQLPLVASYCYTSYKDQGKTLEAIIVELVPSSNKSNDPSFGYVPLSRVRRLQDLCILRPFPISILQSEVPPDLVAQNQRFNIIEQSPKNTNNLLQ